MPELLLGGDAVALVALAQAAGIPASVPNPDGTRSTMFGDFTAQGAGNLVGGFFGALPAGGSLSRIGVATSAARKPVGRESSQVCGLRCLSCSPVLSPSSSRCRSSAA